MGERSERYIRRQVAVPWIGPPRRRALGCVSRWLPIATKHGAPATDRPSDQAFEASTLASPRTPR